MDSGQRNKSGTTQPPELNFTSLDWDNQLSMCGARQRGTIRTRPQRVRKRPDPEFAIHCQSTTAQETDMESTDREVNWPVSHSVLSIGRSAVTHLYGKQSRHQMTRQHPTPNRRPSLLVADDRVSPRPMVSTALGILLSACSCSSAYQLPYEGLSSGWIHH